MSKDESPVEGAPEPADESVRERLEQGAERAAEEFDEGIVDMLAWILDTETRARIYVFLRKNSGSTSEEIAQGTGLYPSTVREALAELHDDTIVERSKRAASGAGNNPYEYTAIAPSELVTRIVKDIQDELNTVFNLDSYINGRDSSESEPVTITVEDSSATDADTGDDDDAENRSHT